VTANEPFANWRKVQRRLHSLHAVPPLQQDDSPAKLAGRMKRSWRVVLLRNKGEILGQVEAPDVASAKAAAALQFDLDEVQRNRIMVQELG
jgi:hypothetical protein